LSGDYSSNSRTTVEVNESCAAAAVGGTMPALIRKLPKWPLLSIGVLLIAAVAWIVWNRPRNTDMASYVPAESIAYIEANDLSKVADGLSRTEAWRTLAEPLGAPRELISHSWLVSFARWSGIGTAETVMLARSQFAVCFAQPQATESGATLTIKPLAALVIETHTSQNRMRSTVEKYVDQLARESYGSEVVVIRKQLNGADLQEWSTPDNSRRLILSMVDTIAILGNDESVVISCLDVHARKRKSLAEDNQFQLARQNLVDAASVVFAYVPKPGVKAVVQAWALSRAEASANAASVAPLIANTFGNLIDGFAWAIRYDEGGAEDRCRVALAQGVAQQLSSATRESLNSIDVSLIPADAMSLSLYNLSDAKDFWAQLNAVVSSHSDVVGAIASRPLLQGLLEPYGIREADRFFAAIGPRLQIIRLEQNAPAVLIAEASDRESLKKIATDKLGTNAKVEQIGQAQISVSASDNWATAFLGEYFLTGPVDEVRRCVAAKAAGESIEKVERFHRARSAVDLSLPILSLSFADDRASAISLVELFSKQERPAFSTNATAIRDRAASLKYSASVVAIKNDSVEWTTHSSFGLVGSLLTTFAPEKTH
jgi:hypothetical protein